ncbi:MAG: GNAT family N-acetyltransferase [Acidimicrobiia bacterium]|nr:GNAT family N-acetyltransferase [Acidimicrobiia bacterium]
MLSVVDGWERLQRHLETWLGAWPPPTPGVTVVGSDRRSRPGWDGSIRPVAGVATPSGTVLSVPPDRVEAVRRLGDDLDAIGAGLGEALGRPGGRLFAGVFRWTDEPAPDQGSGTWVPTEDPRVPDWLKPFNGDVLLGLEDGQVAAGVGRKQHDRWGHELAVVTEPGFRGRGWASDLVAQAAHRVLADGAVPTYFHSPTNEPSARTADASGFPDRGWRVLGLSRESRT